MQHNFTFNAFLGLKRNNILLDVTLLNVTHKSKDFFNKNLYNLVNVNVDPAEA